MNLLKKYWYSIFVLSLALVQQSSVFANFEDDFDFSCITTEDLNKFEKEHPTDYSAIRSLPANVIAALLEKAKITAPLWSSTAVPAGRDILYHFPYTRVTGTEY